MSHKLRTFLTMFGIAWGIISITLMVAAGQALRVGQRNVAKSFSKDVMIVFPDRPSLQAGGARAGRRIRFRANDHEAVAEQSPSSRAAQWSERASLNALNLGRVFGGASIPPWTKEAGHSPT